jgi:tetratricopeptide (TPR) repeat protein
MRWVGVLLLGLALAQGLDLARSLLRQGQYELALARLEREPPGPEVLALKGRAYLLLGRPEAAREALEGAARLGRGAEVERLKGWLALEAGNPEEARRAFQAAAIYSGLPQDALLWALAAWEAGRPSEEALARAERAGGGAEAALLKGLFLLAQDPAEALAAFRRAGDGPFKAQALYLQGLALEALGRDPEAREAYRQALKASPDYLPARRALGL